MFECKMMSQCRRSSDGLLEPQATWTFRTKHPVAWMPAIHAGMTRFRLALLILFLADIGSASAFAQDLLKLPVAIPAVTPAATTFVVARDRGYFREEGLDVQLIVMPSAIGTQALIGGNVKFSTIGGAALLPMLRGAPLRFLFTTFNRPMFWLYAKPEIRSIEALRGKKVGVSSLGSGPDSLLRDLLKKHAMEGGRDVVILADGFRHGAFPCAPGRCRGRRHAFDPEQLHV